MKKMKMFMLGLMASLTLVSCSKDEVASSQELIVGDWLDSQWGYVYSNGIEALYENSVRCEANRDYVQFFGGGHFTVRYSNLDCKSYTAYTGKWSLTDIIFTVSASEMFAGFTSWEIVELIDKVLKIKTPYSKNDWKTSANSVLIKEEVPVSYVLVFNPTCRL